MGLDDGTPSVAVFVRRFLLVSVLAFIATLAAILMAYYCLRAITDLSGTQFWLATGYGVLVFGGAVAVEFAKSWRSWVRARRNPDALPSRLLAELNRWNAWLMRILTIPIALLAAGSMANQHFPLPATMFVAVAGWLALDLCTWAAHIGRQGLHRLNHT